MPPITEPEGALKQHLRHEQDSHKKQRLPMLDLLASGQARDRQQGAHLLGGHRHTMGRWLALYAASGLHALLTTDVPAGKPVPLAPDVLASLEQALHRPEGFASSEALRQWVRQTHGGSRSSTTRSTPWCVCASRPSSTWPDRVTPKNPEAIPAFQTACVARLQQVIPPANTAPVRVFSQDESRFGLLTGRRRRLTARGVQPIGRVQPVFEWFYVYGAVAPTTGDRFFLAWPYLNAEGFQLFLDAFAAAFPDSLNLLGLDHSGAHTAQRLALPANVRLVFLPPYCPELNPIARGWRDLTDALAWLQFPTLDVQQDYLATLLQGYAAATLQALTGYTSLVEAIHALCPS